MKSTLCSVACASVLAIALPIQAKAQSYNQFLALGDSTIDSGWWKAALPGNATGKAAKDTLIAASIAQGGTGAPVGAGYLMNTQILASYFNLTAIPANQTGGTNYAISGAVDAAVAANGNIGNLNSQSGGNPLLPSTAAQVTNYLASTGGVANAAGLYLISSGGNDITFASNNFVGGVAQRNYLSGQAAQLTTAVQRLQAAGAQYIVVSSTQSGAFNSTFYTQALWNDLAAAGVRFVPADIQSMVRAVQANPTMFGFTAATVSVGVNTTATGSACINATGATVTSGWSQWCVNTTTPSSTYAYLRSANAQQTSFFADDEHFSAAGQKIRADYTFGLLVAPSQISFLAEAPVKTRAGVVNSIWNQIPVSQQQTGRFTGWVAGDISSLKMNNSSPGFPNDPGTPVALTAGFDYKIAQDWLVGLAFSVGTTKQSFSLGGDYTQKEFAASAYAAYSHGPYWLNVAGTYGTLNFDVNRVVPLGITMQSNIGSTSGRNISFAAETGYNFMTAVGSGVAASPMPVKAPAATQVYLKHGPVVGLVLQQVRVGSFTESDAFASTGGLTALGFDSQTRNSAVSELGYQASVNLGKWQPFAKAAWNHEMVSTNRSVTATLTSAVAPSFSLPAVTLGKDWGTAMLGTRVAIGRGIAAYGSLYSQFAQSSVTTYGGQVGLSTSF